MSREQIAYSETGLYDTYPYTDEEAVSPDPWFRQKRTPDYKDICSAIIAAAIEHAKSRSSDWETSLLWLLDGSHTQAEGITFVECCDCVGVDPEFMRGHILAELRNASHNEYRDTTIVKVRNRTNGVALLDTCIGARLTVHHVDDLLRVFDCPYPEELIDADCILAYHEGKACAIGNPNTGKWCSL